MTHQEWTKPDLTTGFALSRQIDGLIGRASSRQIGLFLVACAHRVRGRIRDDVLRAAVVTAEAFAHGRATEDELGAAFRATYPIIDSAEQRYRAAGNGLPPFWERSHEWLAAMGVYWLTNVHRQFNTQNGWAGAEPFAALMAAGSADPLRAGRREAIGQMACLRDVFGDPFDPVVPDPRWRTSAVAGLAQRIYDEPAFDRLPILADALEDAGCADTRVLNHCRRPGRHVRGCWVVDMVLGHERSLTAREWETTADVGWMLRTAWPRTTTRKLQLVACGCARQAPEYLDDDLCAPPLRRAEQFIEGLTLSGGDAQWLESGNDRWAGDGSGGTYSSLTVLDYVKIWHPARVVYESASHLADQALNESHFESRWRVVADDRRVAPARVMRCVIGNPLRPAPQMAKKWRTAAVVDLARHIYDTHAFDRMADLAALLEQAGCASAAVLAHCRDRGPFPDGLPADHPVPPPPVHARGCWVIDSLLGKE